MRRAFDREEQLKHIVERRIRSALTLSGKPEETFTDMVKFVNEYYNGAIDWLKNHYKELNDSDVELICLLFFNFSPQELCVIYGLENVGAIYTRCSRVAKKLKIGKNTSIRRFLEGKIDELRVQKCCLSYLF
jgi:hypothetical protein